MASKALSIEQMYRVLRGLPGEMLLQAPDKNNYRLIIENPNAPKNRCQETLGLSVCLSGPLDTDDLRTEKRLLTEEELDILRSGEPLVVTLMDVEVVLNSNPGGHLIELEGE